MVQSYCELKILFSQVRGLVRNATKAKEILSCGECTATEGIFEGDVTVPASLPEAFDGVRQLVVLTGDCTHSLRAL